MNEETKLLDLEVRKVLAKIQNNIDELNKQNILSIQLLEMEGIKDDE